MRVLRVLLPAPPDAARADAYAVFDAGGRRLERGQGTPASWPATERREAVLGADAVRVVALALPPLPHSRLIAAATFALEDRLATTADEAVIAVGSPRSDGRVNAIVVARELADALAAATPLFTRAIAEPELAPASEGWHWCEGAGGSFVRTSDGGAFAVSRSDDATLPAELALALARATREGQRPAQVVVHRPVAPASLKTWETFADVRFVAGETWRWDEAEPRAFAAATDVLAASRRPVLQATPNPVRGYLRALVVVVAALVLHFFATLASWGVQRVGLARAEQALVALADRAGAVGANISNAGDAITGRYVDARHRAGLAAPTDALPVLASAAPALAALPPNTLKTATWTGGAWTIELAPVAEAALGTFANRLAAAGVSTLHAKTPSGVRVRLSPAP